MSSFALSTLALAALCAAGPPAGRPQGFPGGGPGSESEPNDRLGDADVLGTMPAEQPLAVWGEIAHAKDRDVFRVDVLVPTVLDLRVVTGGVLMPYSEVGGSGHSDPIHTDSFLPVLSIYGPDGRLIFVTASAAPNLLLLGLSVPLVGSSFYVELAAWPGSFGPYGLQVSVH